MVNVLHGSRVSSVALMAIFTGALTGAVACSKKSGAGSKAIFSGDKGLALVPARRFVAKAGSGAEFDNSIRMMMLPVKCSNQREVVKLESFALTAEDGVRFHGGSILDANGQPIPGTSSCVVFGNYALHLWATQYLFPREPKSEQEFVQQQWMYLALRGPYIPGKTGARPPALQKFYTEAGAIPVKGGAYNLAVWDSLFNPCSAKDTSAAAGFRKDKFFKCEGANYRALQGTTEAVLGNQIEIASEFLIDSMNSGEFRPTDVRGIETAIRVDGVLYEGGFSSGKALSLAGKTGSSRHVFSKRFFQRRPLRTAIGNLFHGRVNGSYNPQMSNAMVRQPERPRPQFPQGVPSLSQPSSPAPIPRPSSSQPGVGRPVQPEGELDEFRQVQDAMNSQQGQSGELDEFKQVSDIMNSQQQNELSELESLKNSSLDVPSQTSAPMVFDNFSALPGQPTDNSNMFGLFGSLGGDGVRMTEDALYQQSPGGSFSSLGTLDRAAVIGGATSYMDATNAYSPPAELPAISPQLIAPEPAISLEEAQRLVDDGF